MEKLIVQKLFELLQYILDYQKKIPQKLTVTLQLIYQQSVGIFSEAHYL